MNESASRRREGGRGEERERGREEREGECTCSVTDNREARKKEHWPTVITLRHREVAMRE
jgi:hypothetical protein